MNARRYAAALIGNGGIYHALRRLWASRFSGLRLVVMIMPTQDKLTLRVSYHQSLEHDVVTLKRKNWRTGEERVLFHGTLEGHTLGHRHLPRD